MVDSCKKNSSILLSQSIFYVIKKQAVPLTKFGYGYNRSNQHKEYKLSLSPSKMCIHGHISSNQIARNVKTRCISHKTEFTLFKKNPRLATLQSTSWQPCFSR